MRARFNGLTSLGALNAITAESPNGAPQTLGGGNQIEVTADIPEYYLVEISGTFVGTLTFQGNDGISWFPVGAQPVAGGAEVTSATAVGAFRVDNRAIKFRVQMTAYTSGAANVSISELHESLRD